MISTQPLFDQTQLLREDVERAGLTSWRILLANTVAHVQNLRGMVEPTERIDEAFLQVVTRCMDYAQEIAGQGLLFSPDHKASRQARQLALLAIDELELRLRDARPIPPGPGPRGPRRIG